MKLTIRDIFKEACIGKGFVIDNKYKDLANIILDTKVNSLKKIDGNLGVYFEIHIEKTTELKLRKLYCGTYFNINRDYHDVCYSCNVGVYLDLHAACKILNELYDERIYIGYYLSEYDSCDAQKSIKCLTKLSKTYDYKTCRKTKNSKKYFKETKCKN